MRPPSCPQLSNQQAHGSSKTRASAKMKSGVKEKPLSSQRPLSEDSLLRRTTYSWANQFLDLCYAQKSVDDGKVSVSNDDVFSLPEDESPAVQREAFQQAFHKNAGSNQWRGTIFDMCKRVFLKDFGLQLMATVGMLMIPFLSSRLVDWLPTLESRPWWHPYVMALCISILMAMRSYCHNYGITISSVAACRFAYGLTGAVHQKMMVLSAKSKQQFGGGSVANLIAMDPMRFNMVMLVLPHLIIGPFQIIGSIGLLSLEVGWTALAGLVVILLYLPFQFSISKRLDRIREVCMVHLYFD
jgi:hypothetical protein